MKVCKTCGQTKPFEDFKRASTRTKDGRQPYRQSRCKSCENVARNRSGADREAFRSYYRKNRSTLLWKAAVQSWSARGVDREFSSEDREYFGVVRRDPCAYCGAPGPSHTDHIQALATGGRGGWENLTASCRRCNSRKNTRTLLDFLLKAA